MVLSSKTKSSAKMGCESLNCCIVENKVFVVKSSDFFLKLGIEVSTSVVHFKCIK